MVDSVFVFFMISFGVQVSTSADEEDSNDLEIQHTLGGLAISQTNTPEVRGKLGICFLSL